MSNYHVLDTGLRNNWSKVAFHIPIPDETNVANYNLRTALSEYKSGYESEVPYIDSAEQDQITAGEIYEHIESVTFTIAMPNVDRISMLDAMYTALETDMLNKIRLKLKFWGYSKDVS